MLSPSLGITASQGTGIGQQQLKAAQSQPPEEPRCRGGSSPAQGAPPSPSCAPKPQPSHHTKNWPNARWAPRGHVTGGTGGKRKRKSRTIAVTQTPGDTGQALQVPIDRYIYRYPRLWIRHTTGLVGSPSRSLKIFSFFFILALLN